MSYFSYDIWETMAWKFKKFDGGKVVMNNNVACKVDRIGNVTLKFENWYIYTLEKVRYVPKLNRNYFYGGFRWLRVVW